MVVTEDYFDILKTPNIEIVKESIMDKKNCTELHIKEIIIDFEPLNIFNDYEEKQFNFKNSISTQIYMCFLVTYGWYFLNLDNKFDDILTSYCFNEERYNLEIFKKYLKKIKNKNNKDFFDKFKEKNFEKFKNIIGKIENEFFKRIFEFR